MIDNSTGVVELTEGVWVTRDPVRFLGLRLTTTMTLLRLADGTLLVYSPVELTQERRAAVNKLGRVAHIYAPNLFHHLHVRGWLDAFPNARFHGPKGLETKCPDLRVHRVHGSEEESGLLDTIDEIPIAGFRLGESALFYRPTGVLLVADLVHNIGRPAGVWTHTYTRLMGFYDRVALSRMIRWTAFSDRKAARMSIDRLLALPLNCIVVGHGSTIHEGAREALSETFAWLPSQGQEQYPVGTVSRSKR
jgi:hypothetical protein